MKTFALPAALLAGLGIFAMTAPATAASSATLDSAHIRAVTPTTMQYAQRPERESATLRPERESATLKAKGKKKKAMKAKGKKKKKARR